MNDDLPSVLLVDDDPRNLHALGSLLEGLGARLVTVRSGVEALKALLDEDFAVIVLDVRMPELDGFETAELIRARDRSARTPIIFVTGNDPTQDGMFRGYEVGAVDYIVKPVHPAVLRSKVGVFLDLHLKTREVQRQAELLRLAEQREHEARIAAIAAAERQRTEEAVRAVAARMDIVLSAVPIVVCAGTFAPDPRITSVTPNVERVTGFEAERFVAEPTFWSDRIHPDDRDATLQRLDRLAATGAMDVEYRWACASGWRWFLHHAVLVPHPDAPPGIVGTWLDITERRRHEDEMANASKLQSLGVLAGGIAHDFNNLLTGITASVSLAITLEQAGRPIAGRLGPALAACERASRLARQLLTFARGGEPRKQKVVLHQIVRDAATFALQGSRCRLRLEVDPDLWTVEADAGQVAQAVQNLVINADQAMADGGTVVVSVRNCTLPDVGPDTPPLPPGRYVRTSVSDQGAGIPAEIRDRVFDPFYSTKPNGSGLGLSTVYSIAQRHDGYVCLRSSPGQETTFHLYLPAVDAPREEQIAHPPDSSALGGGRGRILVMDDDPQVREVLVEALELLGYEPEVTSDGAEAVERYRAAFGTASAFDALVMDLTVPGGMGGAEATRLIRALDPSARAIVSSGYANAAVLADAAAHGFAGVLPKPWQVGDLDAALTAVLGAGTSGAVVDVTAACSPAGEAVLAAPDAGAAGAHTIRRG